MDNHTPKLFVHTDNTIVKEHVVGIGGAGIVIQQENFAVKIPLLLRETEVVNGLSRPIRRLTPEPGGYDERQNELECIEHEKSIYQRLGRHENIVTVYDLDETPGSIKMDLMTGEDLQHHIATAKSEQKIQLAWLLEIARVMDYIHSRRVLICDLRTNNLLLNHESSIKMVDFGESELMPIDWDFQGGTGGFSITTEIGQFGAVMYEIVTGEPVHFNSLCAPIQTGAEELRFPPRHTLPTTNEVWMGHIIGQCWTEGCLASAKQLIALLEQVKIEPCEG